MSKFEKLIEYVVNEDMEKARELFHDLCVEKSRDIYENLLDEEDLDEADEEIDESDEDLDEAEEVDESDEDLDEAEEVEEGFMDEDDDEFGDELAPDDMMSDIDADEGGMDMDMGAEEDIEDRVVDLEDALDELEAKFSEIVDGGEYGEEGEDDMGMEFDDEEEEGGEEDMGMDMDMEDEPEMEESMVREYTEKVSTPSGSKEAGAGGSVGPVGKSPVAKSGKGSIKLNTGDESGASDISGVGSFADGMDPKVVGKKVGKGPKAGAPTAKKEDPGKGTGPLPKSHN